LTASTSGWKVLLVDMDPQGNLGLDLGYRHGALDDDGSALAQSLMFGSVLTPLKDVRPNLDVIPGGAELDQAAAGLIAQGSKDGSKAKLALARSLSPIAAKYDIIFIDCHPAFPVKFSVLKQRGIASRDAALARRRRP